MKKYFFFILIWGIVFYVAFTGCTKREKEIKIGAILPLTGDLAVYGENAKNGINLYADEFNKKGGFDGQNVKLIYEDSQALPDKAVTAVQKLHKIDRVVAIIGDVASSTTLAIAPIVNKNKIVVVSPAASSPDITTAGPYIYRVWPSDVFEADRMAEYVINNSINNIAIFYVNNDYGRAMLNEFKSRLENKNIAIVTEENFEQNTTDVRAQLARIKNVNADFIYLISYPKDTIIILIQFRELGLKSKILSTSSFEDPSVLKEVGEISEGAIFTSPIPANQGEPVVSSFKKNYENRFHEKPGLVSDYGYDALMVVLEAIKISGKATREGVQEGITKIRDLNGATGAINFDENGDVVKPAGIKTVKSKEYGWLEK